MGALSEATRPILWNISAAWLMYLLMFVALGVFAFGVQARVAAWRRGRAANERLGDWGRRLGLLIRDLAFQRRVRGARYAGIFHCALFYAFAVLLVTTFVVALDYDLGTSLFEGALYVALTVASEAAGVLVLFGVGMALWRRLARRPTTLPREPGDVWPLALLAGITITGFLVEGLRIATLGDAWAALTPVGQLAALPFEGLSESAGRTVHAALWWAHTTLALGWIASIPYSRFFHLLALPTNVFFAKLGPRGALRREDVAALMAREDLDGADLRLGTQTVEDLTWKQRLDLDACVSCGRCEAVCPAFAAGLPFSPRQYVAKLRTLVSQADLHGGDDAIEPRDARFALVGGAFDERFVWLCRTCMACMEVCPAAIDHVDSLIEVRRNEVMMQGRAPADAGRTLRSLEVKGNPFGPQSDRVSWTEGLGVRVVKPGEHVDVLFWVGCCVAFDPTKRRIAEDLCRLLARCGIDFGVLGADERCCGDPARVLGDERLFQKIAKAQVELLSRRSFQVLLTSCPHCYNVLENEYPQFGADFDVVHHSEFLHEMLWGGELLPDLGLARRVVYHDPCYLGRYQKMYDAPREVLRSLPGVDVVEMKDNRERSFCCGAGGGHYWMDLHEASDARVNNLRVEQAQSAGADTIVTACAYCKQMLDDAVKQKDLDEAVEVIDIATLVARSLPPIERRDARRDESTLAAQREAGGA